MTRSASESNASVPQYARRIAISGASGLVGQALCRALTKHGYCPIPMVRGDASSGEIPWDPSNGTLQATDLESVEAVVHLAGEPVFGRWTDAKKARIMNSRVQGTSLIARALADLATRSSTGPRHLVCASAIGYYGDRGDQIMTEASSAGDGFLAEVCERWEAAAEPARAAGLKVAHVRLGVVLSQTGGALEQMLLPFRLGVGGKLGHGRQWMSWIHLDDLVAQILYVLEQQLIGVLNAVSPQPVRNAAFTKILGAELRRPTFLPVPGFAARLAMGEMANEMLLSSTRVAPTALEAAGYQFRFTTLEAALAHELGK